MGLLTVQASFNVLIDSTATTIPLMLTLKDHFSTEKMHNSISHAVTIIQAACLCTFQETT